MTDASVSVIIPAFNAERFLAEAIDSALSQTLPPEEIIVVNDGSGDGTAGVAARYGSRINYLAQPNQGIGAARNAAIARASGAYLAFLDADDIWTPHKSEWQVRTFDEDPAVDLVFGQMRRFDDLTEGCPAEPEPGIVPSALMVRRATFLQVGWLDMRGRIAEFLDWLMRARELKLREHVLPRVVLHRRVHESNVSVERRDEKYSQFLRALGHSIKRRRVPAPAAPSDPP
jgi:glycosyltransferase involved in cell wall biosynthesis